MRGMSNNDGIKAFYANGMLRNLSIAVVGIFTPVFLYRIGLREFGEVRYAVMLVAGYYLLTRLVTLLFDIPISHIIEKKGFRKSILISIFLLAANLVTLVLCEKQIGYVAIAAIASGLNIPFYWLARNSAISQDGDKKHVGSQMGWMTTFEQIASMLGPLAAGLVIEKWGFEPVFGLSLLILFLSVIPLWSMSPHVHKNGATIKGFWYFLTNRRYFHNAVGMGARAVDDYSISVLWPLAIFIMGIKTSSIGGLFSLVSLVALFTRMGIGRVFDKLHARHDFSDEIIFAISSIASAILWMARLFVGTLSAILTIDLVGAVFGTTYSNLYIDYEQLGGMRMGNIAYWVYGEMVYSIMTIGIMGLTILGAYFSVWREVVFLSASFWLLISIVMARESNMR